MPYECHPDRELFSAPCCLESTTFTDVAREPDSSDKHMYFTPLLQDFLSSPAVATLTVVDMSYSSPGMRLLFFAKDMDLLPRVAAPGDVIRIHRLEVGQLNNLLRECSLEILQTH